MGLLENETDRLQKKKSPCVLSKPAFNIGSTTKCMLIKNSFRNLELKNNTENLKSSGGETKIK